MAWTFAVYRFYYLLFRMALNSSMSDSCSLDRALLMVVFPALIKDYSIVRIDERIYLNHLVTLQKIK